MTSPSGIPATMLVTANRRLLDVQRLGHDPIKSSAATAAVSRRSCGVSRG
jgi:hypothetical protein